MIDQHPLERAPGIARVLAVLMLLAGIVAMHSAVFGTAHASTADPSHTSSAESSHANAIQASQAISTIQMSAEVSDSLHASTATGGPTSAGAAHAAGHTGALIDPTTIVLAAAPAEDRHGADTGCGAAGCGEHAAVHSCVFVLAALAFALTLVLLYRLTNDIATTGHASARPWRGRRERPPPWTVLSLAQLAILRI
ncbi:DUF6153 family protein [Nocardia sp. NPDC057663]|uniref:DUF6153 family protein n=1 Tax=Nocardia sp. NPDC057663 TaxID=3346201 RepID=UPI00366C11DF